MIKTKNLIFGLGTIAAIGIASVPGFSYANNPDTLDITVSVSPVIALQISGNNDDNPCVTTGSSPSTYCAVTDVDPDGTPITDISGNPITETTIKTSSSSAELSANNLITGDSSNGFLSTLKVSTNDSGGYTLKVAAKTASDINMSDSNGHSINSVSSTTDLVAGDGKWGLQADAAYSGSGLTTNSWSPITTSGTTVKTSGTLSTPLKQDTTKVKYGVATSTNQPAGIYSSTLTYTATTAN